MLESCNFFVALFFKYRGKVEAYCSRIAHASERIRYPSQVLQGHVLVVAQHLIGGVADQFQLVLVRAVHPLHKCGEGVAAGVRGVTVPLGPLRKEN